MARYTGLNPVRAGMVERPEDYRWSSYRATVGLETTPSWLTTSWTLSHFGPDLATQRSEYAKFVDAGASISRSPFEDLVANLFLGTRGWIERMQKITDSKLRSSEHPAPQRYAGRPKVDKVIETVAKVFSDKRSTSDSVTAGENVSSSRGCAATRRTNATAKSPRRCGSGAPAGSRRS